MPIVTASVYVAASVGAAAGLAASGKYLNDPTGADYAYYTLMAKAFATAIDTAWTASGTPSPTCGEIYSIQSAAFGVWSGDRSPIFGFDNSMPPVPLSHIAGSYFGVATAIVAFAQQQNAQLILDGIDPNAACNVGGGGGGITQLTGDTLAGPGAGSQASTTVALTGSVVDSPIGGGNLVPIGATDTLLNSTDVDQVHSFTAKVQTLDNTPTQIGTSIVLPATGIQDYSLSFIGFNPFNGDFFRCDLVFTVTALSGVDTLFPGVPAPINTRSSGSGAGCSAEVTLLGGDVIIKVTGVAFSTFNWTCIGQIQSR
jgi:hypothetical protein